MAETFRLIRVFLASPGDLQDERRLASEAVEELNKGIASHFDCRVDLKGWEDTLPGSGRPQSIINRELDRCELFIGIMWKRWGTPPATQGSYTSGFEEEFELSATKLKKTGNPEMAMYFKEIPQEYLVDPGKNLKKVLEFKKRIISEKIILFKTFSEPNDFQKCVRLKITDYLIKLQETEVENLGGEQAKVKNPTVDIDSIPDTNTIKSPFSVEGHSFLKDFIEKTEAEDSIESITLQEVARFRLLSSAITKSGNHEPFLGVHDANILFSNRDIKYGSREISRLIDCGLKNIRHENTPLWYWCKIYKEGSINIFLAFKSLIYSDEDVSAGALKAMKLIGLILPTKEIGFDRNTFITKWLSKKRSDNVKLAALDYLKYHGKEDDLPLIQSELDQSNTKTVRISIEAILSIQLRHIGGTALKTAFTNDFELIDEALLEKVLSDFSNLDDKLLKLGLKHRNKRIRLESFKRLRESKKINLDELKELKSDPFTLIRKEVIELMLSENQSLNDQDIRNILINPQKNDGKGHKCYDEYLFSKYSGMAKSKLLELSEKCTILDYIPYLALCNRYFKNHSVELRKNIGNQFKDFSERSRDYLEKDLTSDELIKKIQDIVHFLRKEVTRKSLDILCRKAESKDLNIIRENMRSDYVKSSMDEIKYMQKWGEWEDISFIVKSEEDYSSKPLLTTFSNYYNWNHSIAETVYNIGRDRLDELLKMEMPSKILVELIKICSITRFSEISDDSLLSLLNNEEDTIRKVVSSKCIQSFKKSKLKYLLKNYMDSDKSCYYNVIFWLDFGISMPKSRTNKAIKLILKE